MGMDFFFSSVLILLLRHYVSWFEMPRVGRLMFPGVLSGLSRHNLNAKRLQNCYVQM